MSVLLGDASPDVALLQSNDSEYPPWWRDRSADYKIFSYDEPWSRGQLTGNDSDGVGTFVYGVWFEPLDLFGGTHTDYIVLSDQLTVDLAEATTNWLTLTDGATVGPSTIDDYRIEGSLCLRERLSSSTSRFWSMVIMPGATRVWQYDASPVGYVDITTAFNDATATDTNPWPATEAVGDQMQVGWKVPFGGIVFTIGTLGVGGTLTWKYWNGTTWAALAGVTDGTSGFTAAGTVTWTVPSDWTQQKNNSSEKLFYVAAEVATVYSTNPVITQGLLMYASGNGGYSVYLWANNVVPLSTDTWLKGGHRMEVSSDLTPTLTGVWPNEAPTNSRQWYVGGSDGLKMGGYIPYVFDPSIAGNLDTGSPALTAIRRIGLGLGVVSGQAVNNFSIYWDAVRIGSGLRLGNGSSLGPMKFSDILAVDHQATAGFMFGVITQSAGIFYLTGKLYVGQSDQDGPTYVGDTDQVVVFRNFPVSTGFYEVVVVGNTNGTSTFRLGMYVGGNTSGGCTVRGAARFNVSDPAPVVSLWTLTGGDAYAVTLLYGSLLVNLYRATLNGASEARSCTFQNFGDITAGGATFDSCTFQDLVSGPPVNATYAIVVRTTTATITNCKFVNCATALLWDRAVDTSGKLNGTTFTSGGTGHAIEFGTNTPGDPTEITVVGVIFSGYGGTPGSNLVANSGSTDAAIYNNSGKHLIINITGGGTTPAVRNGASSTTTIVAGVVTTTVTVNDIDTGSAISGARVLVTASDNTGPMPYQKSTTITRLGATATATVTAHGLVDGKQAVVKGADQQEYNGVYTVTVVDANTFTYTVSGAPATPATGTITTTGVVIHGTTNASGIISDSRTHTSNQPITGRVRNATTGTKYKTGSIAGTISSTNGFSVTVQLIKDE